MGVATKDKIMVEYNEQDYECGIEDEEDCVKYSESISGSDYIDSFKLFVSEIGRYPLLSDEEVEKYARLKDAGDEEAKKMLINSNLRLVVSVAKKYQNLGISLMDLIQEGSIGLMIAVDRYDIDRGVRFSTYAWQWIRQSVSRYVMNNAHQIRRPVHMHESIQKVKVFRNEFTAENGRLPSYEEIEEGTGLSEKDIKHVDATSNPMISIDKKIKGKSGTRERESYTLRDIIPDDSPSCEDQVMLEILKTDLSESMEGILTERELQVVKMRFGMCEGDTRVQSRTLEECGSVLGVTRERVRQIEEKAFRKLRRNYKFRRLADYVRQ